MMLGSAGRPLRAPGPIHHQMFAGSRARQWAPLGRPQVRGGRALRALGRSHKRRSYGALGGVLLPRPPQCAAHQQMSKPGGRTQAQETREAGGTWVARAPLPRWIAELRRRPQRCRTPTLQAALSAATSSP
eukprot:CAMPEP_0171122994 /NCGR_PEP_ID=MMETSP0766_2-20121228/106184_1 /TAXON_ID=439317 /ORGANISM="Gambierdiscus australes, Strain CAWD 149" /LENGTH=130 /DNA_ID=CAMNT_0011585853 /DNA_START=44 /DNA_END=436 /DNA_ORIENTATION=+